MASRRKGVKRAPLEIVEQLATERFGVGSAISLDKLRAETRTMHVATAWTPRGVAVRSSTDTTRARAIAALRRVLEAEVEADHV